MGEAQGVVARNPMAHILVVDDEAAVRDALVRQLGALRHRCVEARDGLEALERLHERDFDLVLTDVMMPRLNGFQFLARALPFLKGRVPVVILSSVDDRAGVQAALEAGAYDYLNKPASREHVERVVQEGLRRREEMVRLLGRHRGRGGPVPAEALGERPSDRKEAPRTQVPAGVPAVRTESHVVSIPRPGTQAAAAGGGAMRALWQRVRRWVRGGRAA